MQENKNLLEFLMELKYVTKLNIIFLISKKAFTLKYNEKYLKELQQIQELINTFDFVREENDLST